jgi:hypothetical protein
MQLKIYLAPVLTIYKLPDFSTILTYFFAPVRFLSYFTQLELRKVINSSLTLFFVVSFSFYHLVQVAKSKIRSELELRNRWLNNLKACKLLIQVLIIVLISFRRRWKYSFNSQQLFLLPMKFRLLTEPHKNEAGPRHWLVYAPCCRVAFCCFSDSVPSILLQCPPYRCEITWNFNPVNHVF